MRAPLAENSFGVLKTWLGPPESSKAFTLVLIFPLAPVLLLGCLLAAFLVSILDCNGNCREPLGLAAGWGFSLLWRKVLKLHWIIDFGFISLFFASAEVTLSCCGVTR